uniref:Uncharacterized protein n=1 Tax=Branchiostoma floridae TaxID=7739 RepID=C3ZR70_BRAFL|eukprot:XP_002588932.1 hypothetical protein BRAFLDRAFT_89121 [Branchiostoma floridae]
MSSLTVLLDCIKTQKDCPQAQKQALVALAHLCMENECNAPESSVTDSVLFCVHRSSLPLTYATNSSGQSQLDGPQDQAFELWTAVTNGLAACVNNPQNGEACERLQYKGGLMAILHLAVFTKHLEVQQAALYTLSCAAQINRSCQSKLCIPQVFAFLQSKLSDQHSLPEVKRTAAFLANCLASNNREGQRLARERQCMLTMIQLFVSSLPLTYATNSSGQSQLDGPQDQAFELWTAVTNGLAACVNNPQNEENQYLCSGTFAPIVKLLKDGCISQAVRPICYYLGMVISNNTRGLQLIHQLKTVPLMVQLLSMNLQDSQLQLQVLLTILHLTEMNKEIQQQLVSAGGLSVVLHSMARNQSTEYNKAATYLLKTCVHLDK